MVCGSVHNLVSIYLTLYYSIVYFCVKYTTQIYTKMTHPTLTGKMRTLLQRDRNLQIAVAQEIDMAIVTIYQWAKYYPERLARNPAALKVIAQYMRKNRKITAMHLSPEKPRKTQPA